MNDCRYLNKDVEKDFNNNPCVKALTAESSRVADDGSRKQAWGIPCIQRNQGWPLPPRSRDLVKERQENKSTKTSLPFGVS